MTEYLDKEKLVAYLNQQRDRAYRSTVDSEHAYRDMLENISKGTFDEPSFGPCKGTDICSECVDLNKALDEKDAEIAKLQQALSLQCDDTLKERQEENIRRMNSSVPARDPKQDSVYQRLERLEKGQKDLAQGLLGEVSSHKQYLTDLLNCDRRIKALEARPVTYPQPTPYPWNQFWYTSTTAPQFNPCQNCQTIKDFNAQHPSGFVGDSPCATCPNNPYRVTCSK